MRWVGLMILAEVACASASAATSTTPPDLTGRRLVSEWEAPPGRADLHAYVRRRPLVHVMGQHDVVVFDDGAVFTEAKNEAQEDGFLKRTLSGDDLAALREDLARFCPALVDGFVDCSHGEFTRVTCHVGSAEFSGLDRCQGIDEAGRQVLTLANRVVARVEANRPSLLTEGAEWYPRVDLERTLSPISYKRYAPDSALEADLQQGAARRR